MAERRDQRAPLPMTDDPFELLGVPAGSSEAVVRKAYTRLLKRHRKQPDQVDRLQVALRRALWLADVRFVEGVTQAGQAARPALAPATPPSEPAPEEPGAWLAELAARLDRDGVAAGVAMLAALADDGRPRAEPAWAEVALRAIAALAWRQPGLDAERARLGALPTDPAVTALAARVQADLDAARAFHARYRPVLPPGLLELLADGPLVDAGGRRALATQLRALVLEDPDALLAHWDTLELRCPELVAALAHRLVEDVPLDRREWAALAPAVAAELVARVRAAAAEIGIARAVVIAAIGAAATAATFSLGGPDGGTGLSVPAVGIWVWLDGRQYHHGGVRERLARLLIDAGVTRACLRWWLDRNRVRAFRVARFSWHAGRDQPLLLVGLVAAASMAGVDPA